MEVKPALVRSLCAAHQAAVERDRGWQERERATGRAQRKRLREATDEARLFDPGPPRPVE